MRPLAAAVLLLAGCAATGPVPVAAPVTQATIRDAPVAAAVPAAAQRLAAERAGLRRIGYRNCGTYAIELFAPSQVAASGVMARLLYLNAYAYRGGGAIRLSVPAAAARLERWDAGGWQDLPLTTAAGAGTVTVGAGGGVAVAPLNRQLGLAGAPQPGRYRAWLGRFGAARAGAAAYGMTPVWQFTINQG